MFFVQSSQKNDKSMWSLIILMLYPSSIISKTTFFVNEGNASFEDMKRLIDFVSENVFKKTGIKLETEIKILE